MTAASYRASLRAAVRGLWSDVLSYDQAFDSMMSSIRRGMQQAAAEGAAECGIKPEELSPAESLQVEKFIAEQTGFISGLLDWVEANKKSRIDPKRAKLLRRKGTLTIYGRLDKWVNTYRHVQATIAGMACTDKKKVFRLGATEKHCGTCPVLNGRTYRYSTWVANNAVPPSRCFQ